MLRSASSTPSQPLGCDVVRAQFSDYLDGQLSGVAMSALAAHLDLCQPCQDEFAEWRTMQDSLAHLGSARHPENLHARLRSALAAERQRNGHLPWNERWLAAWQHRCAPFAVQAAGGFALAIVIAGGLSWIFAAPLAVEANDDDQAHLIAPHYLYSEVPPRAIATAGSPLLVEAKVDAAGRVYDYTILGGPVTPAVRLRLEEDLLCSVYKPATVFGTPVRGHVMLTYTGISVRG